MVRFHVASSENRLIFSEDRLIMVALSLAKRPKADDVATFVYNLFYIALAREERGEEGISAKQRRSIMQHLNHTASLEK